MMDLEVTVPNWDTLGFEHYSDCYTILSILIISKNNPSIVNARSYITFILYIFKLVFNNCYP